MVAAGTGNSEIMAARGIRPLFDNDEEAAQEPGSVGDVTEAAQGANAKGIDL